MNKEKLGKLGLEDLGLNLEHNNHAHDQQALDLDLLALPLILRVNKLN
jgi:hypothetical protein